MSFLLIFFKEGFVYVENEEYSIEDVCMEMDKKQNRPSSQARQDPPGERSIRHVFLYCHIRTVLVIGA